MPKADDAVQEEVKDTSVEESAPQETKEIVETQDPTEALEETEVSLDDFDDEDQAKEESDDKSEGEVVETPKKSEEKPLAPKSENRFQQLANRNREYETQLQDPNFLQQQLSRLKQQESQFATEQELLNEVNPETGEYYTPQEVERIAYAQTREQQAQQIAVERYNMEVQQNQTVIRDEATKALEDFPMFDENNKDAYDPVRAADADRLLEQSLIFNDQGVLVGSSLSPYQIYKTIYDSVQAGDPKRQAQAQKATEKMLANADVAGGKSQATKEKSDPLLEGFDEEAARP